MTATMTATMTEMRTTTGVILDRAMAFTAATFDLCTEAGIAVDGVGFHTHTHPDQGDVVVATLPNGAVLIQPEFGSGAGEVRLAVRTAGDRINGWEIFSAGMLRAAPEFDAALTAAEYRTLWAHCDLR